MNNEKVDEELEELRRARMRKMRNRVDSQKQEKPILDKPVELTDANFKEITQNYQMVVVDCWAPWCGPCNMIHPIIEELAKDYAGKIVFGKLNVDENRKVAMQYQTMSIPTLLVFKEGELADRITGAMPRKLLEPKIIRHL